MTFRRPAKSTRAARCCRAGDLAGESNALVTLAKASCALGRNETAVEASLLAIELAKRTADLRVLSAAHAQLGVALAQCRSYDAARDALDAAESSARRSGHVVEELAALAMRGVCEVLSVVGLRHETGVTPPLEHCADLLNRLQQFKASHDIARLAEPDQAPLLKFVELLESLLQGWMGRQKIAESSLHVARTWLASTSVAPWMRSFEALVSSELAQAERRWSLAEAEARRMLTFASEYGNEPSALLAHIVVCHVLSSQGKHAEALLELKVMAARERRIRSESLATRHEVVAWQLAMRRSEQSRRDLQASAHRLEKLSMEDPLTGIANRRYFELVAREALGDSAKAGRNLCLALMDVDRFKQVNDVHSHVVGDLVLQGIASILTQHIRATDSAARLAGDEFIILFRDLDLAAATEACERVRRSVVQHDWGVLSPGLNVTVSIGVSQAETGDTLEALLKRSDASMYAQKPSSRALASS